MSDEDEAELDDLDEDENKDVRMTERRWDQRIERDNEYDESDTEEMDKANGVNGKRNGSARPAFHDYRNSDVDGDSGAQTPVNGGTDNVIQSKEIDEAVMEDVDPKQTKPEVEPSAVREPEVDAEIEAGGIAEQDGTLKEAKAAAEAARKSSESDKSAKKEDSTNDEEPKGDDEVMQDVEDRPTDTGHKSPNKEQEAAPKTEETEEQSGRDRDGDVDMVDMVSMDDVSAAPAEADGSEVKKEKEDPITSDTTTATGAAKKEAAPTGSADTPKDNASSS